MNRKRCPSFTLTRQTFLKIRLCQTDLDFTLFFVVIPSSKNFNLLQCRRKKLDGGMRSNSLDRDIKLSFTIEKIN